MTSALLMKWQKNDIFKTIQNSGLNPKDFDLIESDSEVQLKHKWSESYFIIGGHAGNYLGSYVTGDAPDWTYEVYSWDSLIERISRWLQEVKRDLETPDLWAELQREAELLEIASDEASDNTLFTEDEQKEIIRRLEELKEFSRVKYSLTAEQMLVLDAKINYLSAAASRLGRTDWRGVFVGVILTYVLATGLPPESARSLFLTFIELLRSIGYLFGHGFPGLFSG